MKTYIITMLVKSKNINAIKKKIREANIPTFAIAELKEMKK